MVHFSDSESKRLARRDWHPISGIAIGLVLGCILGYLRINGWLP